MSLRRRVCHPLRPPPGADALAVLKRVGEIPICISDIYMPEMDGVTFLREALQRYPDMAVVMLTGMAEVNTAVECLKLGALDYISKPVIIEEVRARLHKALEKRRLVLENRYYQQMLEMRVQELDRKNRSSLINGVQTLVQALEAKDAYTSGHSSRVSRYATRTALQLGFADDALEHIRLGGELHDIGKIGTREFILNKPGPLTPEEFQHIMEHSALGEKILAPFLSQSPSVLRIVRSHHERIDGSGFPDALRGEQIPMEARIVAVVDAFDAMTTNRAYRPQFPVPPRRSTNFAGVPASTSMLELSRRFSAPSAAARSSRSPEPRRNVRHSDDQRLRHPGTRGHRPDT